MTKRWLVRKNYLTKRRLQVKYMVNFLLGMSMASLTVGWLLYVGILGAVIPEFSEARLAEKLEIATRLRGYDEARRGIQAERTLQLFREAQLLSAHEQEAVATILHEVNAQLIPKVFLIMGLLTLGSLLLSHRLAGPIYRFERSIQALLDGKLNLSFSLRKGDELHELAGSLNQLVHRWRTEVQDTRSFLQEVSGGLDTLAARIHGGPEEAAIMEQLKQRVNHLQEGLNRYSLN